VNETASDIVCPVGYDVGGRLGASDVGASVGGTVGAAVAIYI